MRILGVRGKRRDIEYFTKSPGERELDCSCGAIIGVTRDDPAFVTDNEGDRTVVCTLCNSTVKV